MKAQPKRRNQDEGQFVKETYHHLVKKANEPDILNKPGMNSKEHTHSFKASETHAWLPAWQHGQVVAVCICWDWEWVPPTKTLHL